MRRINTLLALLFLTIGLFILYKSVTTKSETDELKLYSLVSYNEYNYSETNYYDITYYSTKLIDDLEYYLGDDNNKIILNNVNKTFEKTIYNNELMYIITISFNLENPIELNNCYLELKNLFYEIKLNIGTFKVIKQEDNYIDYNYINGHYSYINNNLVLVGISVIFKENYNIDNIKITNDTYIQLQNIKEIKEDVPNIIDKYENNIFDDNKSTFNIKENTKYFLPIGYNNFSLLGRINLNICDKYLYLPNLHLTHPNINDYPSFIRSGEIVRSE